MASTEEQRKALFAAAAAGSLEDLQTAAAACLGDVAKLRGDAGATLLHVAAQAGATQLCSYLLDQLGCNINAQDDAGNTPLALAVGGGHTATAEALLAHSPAPDVNLRGSGEGAAAPLHLAVAGGHLELALKMLAAGADVNAPSGSGTPLELAAARSNAPMLRALLGAGAAVNAASRQGLTPLFMAVALGASAKCVEALIDAGADVNARALGAFTPLHVAAEGGKADIAEALLKAGADPEAKDEHGHTPARVAAMHKHRALAELLLRRGGAAGSSGVDELMRGAQQDLQEREARAGSSGGGGGGASVVTIPQPEVADEALADTFKRKGNEMFVAGDFGAAAKLYDLALSHWTKNPVVWANRAACYLRLGLCDKALQDAQIARVLDPKYVKAWYREGRAAEGLQRWEDAATAYYQAGLLQPDNEEFMQLTKQAILEGRKALAAQQGQPAAGGGAAGGADVAAAADAGSGSGAADAGDAQ